MNAIALFARLSALAQRAIAVLESAQPLAQLAARLYVAQVSFASGLTKLRDWDITLALFEDEYHVPLLSPEVAAVLPRALVARPRGGSAPARAFSAPVHSRRLTPRRADR